MKFSWVNKKRIAVIGVLFLCAGTAMGFKFLSKPYSVKSANNSNPVVSATISPSPSISKNQQSPAPDALIKESDKAQTPATVPSAQGGSVAVQGTQPNNNVAASSNNTIEKAVQKAPEQTAAPAGAPKADDKGAMPGAVQDKAAELVTKPVSSDDYFKAASTILGKLSFTEMKYIFDSARDDFWVTTSVDEINNIRNILFTKLSDADLQTLSDLGKKYGRSMTILKKDIDVAKEKEKQVAIRSASKK